MNPDTLNAEPEEATFRFAEVDRSEIGEVRNLAEDPVIACLLTAVANQQAAGFKNYIDARQAPCPTCGKPGFNTGWGFWQFVCGAEFHADGTPCEPCPTEAVPA